MRALLGSLLGPVTALVVTWQPVISVTRTFGDTDPSPAVVERLRSIPADTVLKELSTIAVSYPSFVHLGPLEVVDEADRALHDDPGEVEGIAGVPFRPTESLFGTSTEHLEVSSFSLPSLLARAFEVSGDEAYLKEAVQYVLDWSRYESSMWLPRGLVLNDHATAARVIVLAETWRLYRTSSLYDADTARELLRYAKRLARLLRKESLYEYRTNHGIMQNLSLLHLATAFPLLDDAALNFRVGSERLLSQLEYYVNSEGVILEHSPSYQHNGMRRLSAGWRYLGLHGIAARPEMITRYKRAIEFNGELLRPDGSMPLIGDTVDESHDAYPIAEFDAESVASLAPRLATSAELRPSKPTAIAPGAGYAILWNGLPDWPSTELSQIVFHWANFPSQVHKHADELGISLWAGGSEWVRDIGSWPYVDSRQAAVGWRSSNGPHWLTEAAESARTSTLQALLEEGTTDFLDVVRTNDDGSSIRRQLVRLYGNIWVVIDNFDSDFARSAETVWRLSPDIDVHSLTANSASLIDRRDGDQSLGVLIEGDGTYEIDVDTDGSAGWNTGLVSDGEITPSPAIRVTTDQQHRPIVTVFDWRKSSDSHEIVATELAWQEPTKWTLTLTRNDQNGAVIERSNDRIRIRALVPDSSIPQDSGWMDLRMTRESANDALIQPLAAYSQAQTRYGTPFSPQLERRTKVTAAILLAAALQIIVLVVARRIYRPAQLPLVVASWCAWIGLAAYLGLIFLD